MWLVYAGGWEYVLVAGLFYLVGTAFFVWARKESKQVVFTAIEKVLVGVVALALGGGRDRLHPGLRVGLR